LLSAGTSSAAVRRLALLRKLILVRIMLEHPEPRDWIEA